MNPEGKSVRARHDSAAGRVILLVEDEPVILLNLELAAKELGCVGICACSHAEAMQKLQENAHIDAAVLDVQLANDRTSAEIASQLFERSVPFVLHSANLARNNDVLEHFSARLIPKPAAPQRVLAAAIELTSAHRKAANGPHQTGVH